MFDALILLSPRSKINLGLGAYGRSWTLASPIQTAVGSPAYSAGQPGQCTRKQDVLLWLALGWLHLADQRVAVHRCCNAGADVTTCGQRATCIQLNEAPGPAASLPLPKQRRTATLLCRDVAPSLLFV